MRRHFVKKPVCCATEFWATDIATIDDIKSEIQKALDAGTTFEDVDDYLNELYNLELIDDEEFSELINWAAPLTSNGDIYSSEAVTATQVQSGFSFDFIWEGADYDNVAIKDTIEDIFDRLGLYASGIDFESVDYSMYPEYSGKNVSQCQVTFEWEGDYDGDNIVEMTEQRLASLGYQVIGSDFYTI